MIAALKRNLLVLAAMLGALSAPAVMADDGVLWGRIVDEAGKPVPAAELSLVFEGPYAPVSVHSDAAGRFGMCRVPASLFALRLQSGGRAFPEEKGFYVMPSTALHLVITVPATDAPLSIELRTSPKSFSQTVLTRSHIERQPAGHNLWNLVENQDFSATTNRIDVGGLRLGDPARFSGRGSTSWTQNAYTLNGMDVTDPYVVGTPLFYPDVFSLRSTQLVNADLPVFHMSPGALLAMTTIDETAELRGGFSAFWSDRLLRSANITPALIQERIRDSHSLKGMSDLAFAVSGPIKSPSLLFSAALTSQYISRDIAEFEAEDRAFVLSGLASLRAQLSASEHLRLLWTGQSVRQPTLGADRGADPSTTLAARNAHSVVQALWEKRFSERHSLRAGLGHVAGTVDADFQEEARGPYRREMFRNAYPGSAAMAGRDGRSAWNAFADGQALLGQGSAARHLVRYGLKLQFSQASSRKEIRQNMHLLYFQTRPFGVLEFNTPTEHREAAFTLQAYVQESVLLAAFLRFEAGCSLGFSHGWMREAPESISSRWSEHEPSGAGRITWLNLSPRLGLTVPLSSKRASAVRLAAARYHFVLPLNYLTYGNPGALGGLLYLWSDANGDGLFQSQEKGSLLRREGPLFSAIDRDIKRPFVDELVLALDLDLGRSWHCAISGYLRETRNLVETLNTGVPFSAYDPVTFYDPGDDTLPGNWDDLVFTLYNQRPETLGQDFFLLTNPDSDRRVNRYRGADVTVLKRVADRAQFFFSFQAIEAIGSASPGNTELQNDDGVVGNLYDNPNTLINAKGRLRFDRGFTVRLGFGFELFWGIRLASIVKYYDGQPFARTIIISGLNQGPFTIMAHARGVARYEYNRTVDVRLEKILVLGPASRLRFILDGFNVFNRNLATEESEWTGTEFTLRYATEIQSPRWFRVGLSFDF